MSSEPSDEETETGTELEQGFGLTESKSNTDTEHESNDESRSDSDDAQLRSTSDDAEPRSDESDTNIQYATERARKQALNYLDDEGLEVLHHLWTDARCETEDGHRETDTSLAREATSLEDRRKVKTRFEHLEDKDIAETEDRGLDENGARLPKKCRLTDAGENLCEQADLSAWLHGDETGEYEDVQRDVAEVRRRVENVEDAIGQLGTERDDIAALRSEVADLRDQVEDVQSLVQTVEGEDVDEFVKTVTAVQHFANEELLNSGMDVMDYLPDDYEDGDDDADSDSVDATE